MTTPQEGLWSREEVRVQASQVSGQLDVWDCLQEAPTAWQVLQDVCAEHGARCTSLLCAL